MKDSRLISELLSKIVENQNVLGAAVEELTLWLEKSGATTVASNIRGVLETLCDNDAIITDGLEKILEKYNKT